MPKILIIDDRKDNLIAIQALINTYKPDYQVLMAQSGKEGIKIAKEEQPDTILLDIIMPEMDGYEVCQLLKANKSTKHIPIIMLTAIQTDTESKIKGLDVGADAFFTKPIEPNELSAQIAVMLRIKKAEDRIRFEKFILEEMVIEKTRELQLEIAEHKQARLDSQKNEKKFSSIVESSPMGMHLYSLNLDGKLIFKGANPAADVILGVDNRQFIGKTIEEAFPPLADTEVPQKYRLVAEKGESWQTEQIVYEDEKISGAFEVHAFQTSLGKMVALFMDVTKRKLMEDKIRKSEELNRSITQMAADAIISIDDNGIILSWNKSAERIFGYSSVEMESKKLTKIMPTIYITKHNKGIERLKSGGKEKLIGDTIEITAHRKNGTEFPIELSLSSWETDNRKYFTGIIRDITKRKQAEEKLILRNKELEIFNDVTVGRELKILELKKEINELLEKSGEKPKYTIPI